MANLVDIKDQLQNTINLLNNVIDQEFELHNAFEDLIENAKASEIAGIKRPNLYPFINMIKMQKESLETIKFHVECQIEDNRRDRDDQKNREIDMTRWEESIKKIPQKNEFVLEGIEAWHISMHEMIPNSTDIHNQLFREEAAKLIACGFDLGFNIDHGVGHILVTDNGFIIELWQSTKRTKIYKNTLDEVLDWIIYFYEH